MALSIMVLLLVICYLPNTQISEVNLVHSCVYFVGMLLHFIAIILAIIVPVIFAVSRLLLSSHAMNW